MSTGTFIDDFVSNAIDIAIATIGSEGEGQERDAPQVMVTYATPRLTFLIILAIIAISPLAALAAFLELSFFPVGLIAIFD